MHGSYPMPGVYIAGRKGVPGSSRTPTWALCLRYREASGGYLILLNNYIVTRYINIGQGERSKVANGSRHEAGRVISDLPRLGGQVGDSARSSCRIRSCTGRGRAANRGGRATRAPGTTYS